MSPRRRPDPDEATIRDPTEHLQGTLEMLILKTLALGPLHGWAIGRRIQQLSREVLQVQQGSLYPALYRLQDRGWIDAGWETPETGRPLKVYSLTPAGERRLGEETKSWRTAMAAIEAVLAAT